MSARVHAFAEAGDYAAAAEALCDLVLLGTLAHVCAGAPARLASPVRDLAGQSCNNRFFPPFFLC